MYFVLIHLSVQNGLPEQINVQKQFILVTDVIDFMEKNKKQNKTKKKTTTTTKNNNNNNKKKKKKKKTVDMLLN